MPGAEAFTVPEEAAGSRLDTWLSSRLAGRTRSQISAAIDRGEVTVDGDAAKPSRRLRGGERVVVEAHVVDDSRQQTAGTSSKNPADRRDVRRERFPIVGHSGTVAHAVDVERDHAVVVLVDPRDEPALLPRVEPLGELVVRGLVHGLDEVDPGEHGDGRSGGVEHADEQQCPEGAPPRRT